MALVKKMEKLDKERNRIHAEVDCTYTMFTDDCGNRILQLDTYGSTDRKYKGKMSQSIQLGKEGAVELLGLISRMLAE